LGCTVSVRGGRMDEYDYLLVLIFLSAFAGAAFNIALVI
jgi:hypothetical protein